MSTGLEIYLVYEIGTSFTRISYEREAKIKLCIDGDEIDHGVYLNLGDLYEFVYFNVFF